MNIDFDIDKVPTVADWFFGKATVFTGIFLVLGVAARAVVIFMRLKASTPLHETVLTDLGTWLFYLGAALAFLSILQGVRAAKKKAAAVVAIQATAIAEVHTLVNSRLTEALEKIDRLEKRIYRLTGEDPTGEPPRVPPVVTPKPTETE